MINLDEIRALLVDLENDRVERTISTTNTDKFGQAICAFANDLPNHSKSGYLFLGVKDNGDLSGIKVTDDLLKNVAAIRTDGNIQPQPSMTVEKVSLDGLDMVMVKVEPSAFPRVRYKGRIWVRIGPRKGIANEEDERILMEKRRTNVTSFDASPCLNAVLCTTPSSFHTWCLHSICDVRYAGKDRSGDILTEHEFKDNLCTILPELDTFINTTIANRRPIPVTALREEMVTDYPDWATRELVMNAICHRDYASNGPIQFYQYDDRIEIMNHGGLYGRVNESNFPNVNDYRNIVVAEAMKVLGFVNRQSRGVLKLQKDLKANGNGEAVYDFGYQTVVLVVENKSPRGEQLMADAIASGLLLQDGEKPSEMNENGEKRSKNWSDLTIFEFPTMLTKNVYEALKSNPMAKYSWLVDNLGVSEATIKRAIADLKKMGYINAEHSKINGEWQLLK